MTAPKQFRVVILEAGKRPRYAQMAIRPPQAYDVVDRKTGLGRYERGAATALARRIRKSRYWRGCRVKLEEIIETPVAARPVTGEAA